MCVLGRIHIGLLFFLFSFVVGSARGGMAEGWDYYNIGDLERAFAEFMADAKEGDAFAQALVASMYTHGQGVEQDARKAFYWDKKSADQGNQQGMFGVGLAYDLGEVVAEDNSEAIRWYKKAAKLGHGKSAYNISLIYLRGEDGIQRDREEAYVWMFIANRLEVEDTDDYLASFRKALSTDQRRRLEKRAERFLAGSEDSGKASVPKSREPFTRNSGFTVPELLRKEFVKGCVEEGTSDGASTALITRYCDCVVDRIEAKSDSLAKFIEIVVALDDSAGGTPVNQKIAEDSVNSCLTNRDGGSRASGKLGAIAELMNTQTPIQVDEVTTVTRILADEEAQVLEWIHSVNDPAYVELLESRYVQDAFIADTIEEKCGNSELKIVFNLGATIRLTYLDPRGTRFFSFDIDCKEDHAAMSPEPQAETRRLQLASSGSGFFVGKNLLVTNQHVVENCNAINAIMGAESEGAEVWRSNEYYDLAILRTANNEHAVATLRGRNSIEKGEDVFAVGYPLADMLGNDLKITNGLISGSSGLSGDITKYQITAPVQSGNSGGPLLDIGGRVVGVIVGKLDALAVNEMADDLPQNVNFAIKGGILKAFLSANDVSYQEDFSENTRTQPGLFRAAKSFTAQVHCLKYD
jgi:S1-C subfamily serine protease